MNEFQLIDAFVAAFHPPPPPLGPGDDCAVLPPARALTCVTTDALVEGVHFTRRTFSFEDIGHKALAVNLSDLAAMGARPRWALCALGLPDGVNATELRAVAKGMAALAKVHGVELLGGNVTRAQQLSLTLTLGGVVPPGRQPLLRSGARPGDVLYTSGFLGDAAAALHLASHRRPVPRALALAQRRPSPHLAWGLAAAPFASSAVDVSDGLVQDLGHVCAASSAGAELERVALPLSPTLREAVPPPVAQRLALSGGEDYVLLVSVPARRATAFERAVAKRHLDAHRIGRISEVPGVRVDGLPFRGPGGFQHRP
ncbi:MAG: thiamine-phosphate kinase [Myxococcales bacterium]|nr:thiamine-phosphate kinase [Myxococcales bacterium]